MRKNILRLSKSDARFSNGLLRLALLTIAVGTLGVICYGQENPAAASTGPNVELLKLSGSKPNLSANGEGIISYKTTDLFQRGVTRVRPFDLNLKIELPAGYTIFNNLAYVVETEAVFSGYNDVVFSIPSATTKESFDRLRILYATPDPAEPAKPRWVDITVTPSDVNRYLSKAESEKRLPDFNSHTLHAFTQDDPAVMVIALKDSAVARDHFSADVSVTATATPQTVMEGRKIRQVFVVTNNGPDTATDVSFSSQVEPNYVALSQSQGVCRWDAHNIYCNLGSLAKGASATITYDGQCAWNFFYGDRPSQSGGQDAIPVVGTIELDPNSENNMVFLKVPVIKDPNTAPVVGIVSPTVEQFFVGPQATIKIVVQAHDPNGSVGKVELFDWGRPIGVAQLTRKDQYEFTYENVSFGRHWLRAVATDNEGRPGSSGDVNVHVNGQANIKIISPTPNQLINGPLGELGVTIQATHPSRTIKKVEISCVLMPFGGATHSGSPGPGVDEYSTTFKELSVGGSYALYVVVTDDAGVETLSHPIPFIVTLPPEVGLDYDDGEYRRDLKDGTVLTSAAPIKLTARVEHHYESYTTSFAKVEFYADGQLICRDVRKHPEKSNMEVFFNCTWRAKPGKHTLSAVATDGDGVVGKSTLVEVVVR